MKKLLRGPFVIIVLILAILLLTQSFGFLNTTDSKEKTYSEFLEMVQKGEIGEVAITGNTLVGLTKNTTVTQNEFPDKFDFTTYLPTLTLFNEDMRAITGTTDSLKYGFKVDYLAVSEPSLLIQLLPYLIPVVLLGALWYYMMKQTQGGGSKAMSFGKSKARVSVGDANKKTFDDVAGADEEKEELKEIVDFLKSPKRFTALGARIPKGVLLVGPPGGGKTLLAKAVAGEAGVPFFSISGSDFVEMFVGVGASRVRDLFDNAKKNAPCIIFIDEIDAVGRHRGAGLGGGHDEREQTLNQLLVEMDGFQVNEGIIVMAATNRKDILDPALLRPGRFDRQIVVNYPDVKGREDILRVHSKGKPFAREVDLKVLAKRTPGFIGADLENVLNEAAILTARHKKSEIGMDEIEEAITRVIAGPEKRSRVVTEKDKRCTAFHEVGHAICAIVLPGCDPVHEISIVPRGMAAGYTMTLPEEDEAHIFRSKMLDQIAMMLGGRVAEAIVLNDISAGASNDIKRATELARRMVVNFGMSDLLGPIYLGGDEEVFLGRDFGHAKNYSEEVGAQIDSEIRRIIREAYVKAEEILKEHVDKLKNIAEILIAREKLDGEEFKMLFEGKSLQEVEEYDREKAKKKQNAQKAENKPEVKSEPKNGEPALPSEDMKPSEEFSAMFEGKAPKAVDENQPSEPPKDEDQQ